MIMQKDKSKRITVNPRFSEALHYIQCTEASIIKIWLEQDWYKRMMYYCTVSLNLSVSNFATSSMYNIMKSHYLLYPRNWCMLTQLLLKYYFCPSSFQPKNLSWSDYDYCKIIVVLIILAVSILFQCSLGYHKIEWKILMLLYISISLYRNMQSWSWWVWAFFCLGEDEGK